MDEMRRQLVAMFATGNLAKQPAVSSLDALWRTAQNRGQLLGLMWRAAEVSPEQKAAILRGHEQWANRMHAYREVLDRAKQDGISPEALQGLSQGLVTGVPARPMPDGLWPMLLSEKLRRVAVDWPAFVSDLESRITPVVIVGDGSESRWVQPVVMGVAATVIGGMILNHTFKRRRYDDEPISVSIL